jgi:hypothetical protein
MTELGAHGITVTLPSGWEGRVFRRPAAGEVSADATIDGPPAPAGEMTYSVMHVSTIALPPGVGDFASGAVEQLAVDDALIVLFEYGPESVDEPLFAAKGIPQQLHADDFMPGVLQRSIRGQSGVQRFFHDADRAFCLYVVLGSHANRRRLVVSVNQVLATLTIDRATASSAPSPTTTTSPPGEPLPTTTTAGGASASTSTTTSTTAPPATGSGSAP